MPASIVTVPHVLAPPMVRPGMLDTSAFHRSRRARFRTARRAPRTSWACTWARTGWDARLRTLQWRDTFRNRAERRTRCSRSRSSPSASRTSSVCMARRRTDSAFRHRHRSRRRRCMCRSRANRRTRRLASARLRRAGPHAPVGVRPRATALRCAARAAREHAAAAVRESPARCPDRRATLRNANSAVRAGAAVGAVVDDAVLTATLEREPAQQCEECEGQVGESRSAHWQLLVRLVIVHCGHAPRDLDVTIAVA